MKSVLLKKVIATILVVSLVFNHNYYSDIIMRKNDIENETTVNGSFYKYNDAGEIIQNVFDKDINNPLSNYIIGEIIQKRNKYERHFRLDDGSNLAFLYQYPINEIDHSGNWNIINNQLVLVQRDNNEYYVRDGFHDRIVFSAFTSNNQFIDVQTEGGSFQLAWPVQMEPSSDCFVSIADCKRDGLIESIPDSYGNHIIYRDENAHVVYDYQLIGHSIIGTILLNSEDIAKSIFSDITFLISLESFSVQQQHSKTITISGKEDQEYLINSLYMEDAIGNCSSNLLLELKTVESEKGEISILPDKEWLKDSKRQYPIELRLSIDYCDYDNEENNINSITISANKEDHSESTIKYLHFNRLPSLSSVDAVIDAQLLSSTDFCSQTLLAANNTQSVSMLTSELESFGSEDIMKAINNSILLDVASVDTTCNSYVFNISRAIKEWYIFNNNYGLILTDEVNNDLLNFSNLSLETLLSSGNNYPVVQIKYLSLDGLSQYYTYKNLDYSATGSINVADLTGNIVYSFVDVNMTGVGMPTSISHFFSSNNINMHDSTSPYGKGMRLNISQEIKKSNIDGFPYQYLDANGTAHLFYLVTGNPYEDGSTYMEEFNSHVKLTKTKDGFHLAEWDNVEYAFNINGKLISITSLQNNQKQSFRYSGEYLMEMADSLGRITKFEYNNEGLLSAITDPAERKTVYQYDNGCLSSVCRPDGSSILLSYDCFDNLCYLKSITDDSTKRIIIDYSTGILRRVKSITEYSFENTGHKYNWEYDGESTIISDNKGNKDTLLFDECGHTVYSCGKDGIVIIKSYQNTNDDNKHSMILLSDPQYSVTNYIHNHGFENGLDGWGVYSTKDTKKNVKISSEYSKDGNNSLIIESTLSLNTIIDQKIQLDTGLLGKAVTFSIYSLLDYCEYSNDASIYLTIEYQSAEGVWIRNQSNRLRPQSGWQRYSYVTVLPEEVYNNIAIISVVVNHVSGPCYFDSFQLEDGAVANAYNLLENGHFSDISGNNTPTGWHSSGLSGADRIVDNGHVLTGFYMADDSKGRKEITQVVNCKQVEQQKNFVFGVWAKGNVSPKGNNTENDSKFGVLLRLMQNGEICQEQFYQFNMEFYDWQYLTGSFVALVPYDAICFSIVFNGQNGSAIFDEAGLYKKTYGTELSYDNLGRIIRTADSLGLVSSYEYVSDCCPNILRMKDSLGSNIEYYYNDANQLVKTIDENAIQVQYYYDEDGNRIKANTIIGDSVLGNYEESYKDGYINQKVNFLGGISYYEYNNATGTRNGITNPLGVTTNYTFDLYSGLLSDVSCSNSSISYGYSEKRLSSLSHNIDSNSTNTVLYSFEYDEFGEKSAIGVGCYNLVSYLYHENNGYLKKLEFSNGQYLEPLYEAYGRISELRYNGTTAYKFFYGKAGEVGLIIDYENNISWIYEYSEHNQILRINGSDGKVFQFTYDRNTGNILSYDFFDEEISTTSNEIHIEYFYQLPDRTDMVSAISINQGDLSIEYSYDSFERMEKTAKLRSGVSVKTAFSYVNNPNNGNTSSIPDTIIQTVLSEEKNTLERRSFHNVYNMDGSISTVYENDVAMIKYYYDNLGQVIREDNVYLNKTITYEYDFGGNIRKKTQYYYTSDADLGLHAAILSENYYYEDEQWRDKLTAVGARGIVYDEIGNPENYYNGFSFGWGQGRKLTSAKKDDLNIIYSYNESGYCISKNVNGLIYRYLLLDNQVIMETNGQDTIWYYYDESGSPAAFILNDVYYLYLKNLQGDIVGIIDETGMQLVKYIYDVWGKVIAVNVSGTQVAEKILRKNPYLYRGYRYDFDLGLYNLNSRFYDPETGRFINADSRISTFQGVLSCNMYTYCLNNPVNMSDPSGNAAILMNDFTSTGDAIVGHSQVFIQDSEGEYSFTEFTKINGTPKVLTCWVGATYFSNSPYTLIEMLLAVLFEETLSGKDYVFIPGNFTSSVGYAYYYNDQTITEHGSYNFLTNNCVHYAKDVLRQGTASSNAVESVITNSSAFITGTLISQIRNAMQ